MPRLEYGLLCEVLRLHREGGVARSTVRDMVVRFEPSDPEWPVPAEISDAALEARL